MVVRRGKKSGEVEGRGRVEMDEKGGELQTGMHHINLLALKSIQHQLCIVLSHTQFKI